jgi:pimeloyl-ACP methyl ester carboxylesterase
MSRPAAADPDPSRPARTIAARAELAVWEVGRGPAVLCLHGFPDHPVGLLPLAERIAAAGFRAVVPALPGYWPSAPAPGDDYAIPAVARDVLAALSPGEPFAVVGHDWGAEIGYRLAVERPAGMRGLVAIAAPHPAGYAIRRRAYTELQSAWYAWYLGYAPDAAAIASDPRWLTAAVQTWAPGLRWDRWPAVLEAVARPDVLAAVCRYYRQNLETDLEPAPIELPTTVVHGGQDNAIRPELFEDLEAWFHGPYARHLLQAAGHWPHLDAPEDVAAIVVGALRACHARPR